MDGQTPGKHSLECHSPTYTTSSEGSFFSLIPFLLADCVSGFLFAISFEVTLAILGLGDLGAQTLGTMIYWANYYQALLSNRVWIVSAPIIASILIVIGLYLVSISTSSYLDPRSRLERITYKD